VVTAATTLIPLAGLAVLVYDADFHLIAETTTDAAGMFRVAVPAGAYLLAAADPTHHYASAVYGDGATINVAARQDVGPFPIRLAPSATSVRRRSVRH
jgi:hypothetical protein